MSTRRQVVAGIFLALFGTAMLAADDPGKSLQGTWVVVEGETRGTKIPQEAFKDADVVFAKGKMTASQEGKVLNVFTYKVDAAAKPVAIDLVGIEGVHKDKKQPGIFEVDGDELRLCVSEEGPERPTALRTAKDNDWVLLKLARKK